MVYNALACFYVLYTAYDKRWQAGPYDLYSEAEKHIRTLKRFPEVEITSISSQVDRSRESVGKR